MSPISLVKKSLFSNESLKKSYFKRTCCSLIVYGLKIIFFYSLVHTTFRFDNQKILEMNLPIREHFRVNNRTGYLPGRLTETFRDAHLYFQLSYRSSQSHFCMNFFFIVLISGILDESAICETFTTTTAYLYSYQDCRQMSLYTLQYFIRENTPRVSTYFV